VLVSDSGGFEQEIYSPGSDTSHAGFAWLPGRGDHYISVIEMALEAGASN
jgi:hypothetical protein